MKTQQNEVNKAIQWGFSLAPIIHVWPGQREPEVFQMVHKLVRSYKTEDIFKQNEPKTALSKPDVGSLKKDFTDTAY